MFLFAVRHRPGLWRLALLASVLIIAVWPSVLRDVFFQAVSDAFLQVSVFVAATLAVVYLLEAIFGIDAGAFLARSRGLQPLLGACLGALPGCGGAVVVVTQYTRGYITFGSLVAALIATMGDAAFLLLTQDFSAGIQVILVSVFVGGAFGVLVDRIHGPSFMRMCGPEASPSCAGKEGGELPAFPLSYPAILQLLWVLAVVIGLFLGVLVQVRFNFDESQIFSSHFVESFGLFVGGLLLLMSLLQVGNTQIASCVEGAPQYTLVERVMLDTNFVTGWVFLGFFMYGFAVFACGLDIRYLLVNVGFLAPLFAILVGFLPGCGPQIVVTSLYLNGVLPFSAQLGNAISNDGDALFPAIALAPRAAVLATVYSALPACIIAYGYYIFFER